MATHRFLRSPLTVSVGLLLLALADSAVAAGPQSGTDANFGASYTYRTVDYPGSTSTIIWGLDDWGDLAGQYTPATPPAHAMAYRNGRFETLDPDGLFGDYFAAAGGPTEFGLLFGGYSDASAAQHGFLLQWGWVETVDFAGHLNSNIDGVSIFGDIAGVYWDADGVYHGVLRHRGRDTSIDVAGARDTYPLGINADSEIVGFWDTDPTQLRGFRRSSNGQVSMIDVPGAGPGGTAAFGINDLDQISGYFVDTAGLIHGFVQTRGQFKHLDVPGAAATIATAINNFGVVAGEYIDTTGHRHGFVATPW